MGVQFHFHHGSEHTIDGERHDLEMHTVHVPDEGAKGGIKYAAMGIMFSVDKHTANAEEWEVKIIDDAGHHLMIDQPLSTIETLLTLTAGSAEGPDQR